MIYIFFYTIHSLHINQLIYKCNIYRGDNDLSVGLTSNIVYYIDRQVVGTNHDYYYRYSKTDQ